MIDSNRRKTERINIRISKDVKKHIEQLRAKGKSISAIFEELYRKEFMSKDAINDKAHTLMEELLEVDKQIKNINNLEQEERELSLDANGIRLLKDSTKLKTISAQYEFFKFAYDEKITIETFTKIRNKYRG